MNAAAPVKDGLASDLVVGATIWAVLVPSALAYSSIVGVNPLAGLVGVPMALVAYALLGGSRVLVVGADAAVSVLAGSALAAAGVSTTNVLTLSVMVGAIYLLLALLRFGWIADLVPDPVLNGFVQGLVWVTILGQIPALLGMTLDDDASGFFPEFASTVRSLGTIQATTAVLGVASLVVLLGLRAVRPNWPAALIVLVISGAWLAVSSDSAVAVVGAPEGQLISFSDLNLPAGETLGLLAPGAFAIVLLGFTESLGACQIVSAKTGERVEPNRELVGLGAANAAVGAVASYPVTGALSKTSVALSANATSQRPNLVTAGLAVLAALFGRPLFDYLGKPVLAAIVIWAMLGMVATRPLLDFWHTHRVEFAAAMTAFVGVLVFGVMPAVLLASGLSLAILGYSVGHPRVVPIRRNERGRWREVDPEDEESNAEVDASPSPASDPNLVILRMYGPLVFVSARSATGQLRAACEQGEGASLILDASGITAIDSTGLNALRLLARGLRQGGHRLVVAAVPHHIEHRSELLADGSNLEIDTCPTIDEACDYIRSPDQTRTT